MSKPQPPLELRIGRIKAAIWADEAGRKTYHSVSFSRLYRTEGGREWNSDSFRRDDLLLLRKLADQAHTRIVELQADAAAGSASDPDEEAA